MKHFLCHRRGLSDVTIGFFGGIGGCDGAAPSALAAAGSGLRMACSRFRRFSLRLGCSWFRLPPLAALGSLLAAPISLLLASAWPLVVSTSAACRAGFAACRSDFVASRFGLAAPGFGLRRLPHWVRCFSLRLRCSWFRPSSLAAAAARTAKADGARRSHTHKFHFKTLIPTC